MKPKSKVALWATSGLSAMNSSSSRTARAKFGLSDQEYGGEAVHLLRPLGIDRPG